MSIASDAEGVDEIVGALERLHELLPWDLEPSNVIMVPDTKPTESEIPNRGFGCRDLAQFLNRYRIAVRKSRRETGYGRLVPGTQPEAL